MALSERHPAYLRVHRLLQGPRHTVTIEAWIGADDLTVKTVESGKTAKGPAKLTIAYSGYGRTAAIEAPPAKDVTTFAEMIQNAAQGRRRPVGGCAATTRTRRRSGPGRRRGPLRTTGDPGSR